jgi:competence protein ComEC
LILLLIATGWLAGAALGAAGYGHWWPVFGLGGGGVALGLVTAGVRARALLLAAAVLAALASVARYEASLPPADPGGVAAYNDTGEPLRLAGTVGTEPEQRGEAQRFVVDVTSIEDGGWQPSNGRVLVTVPLYPQFAYGDLVELWGEVEAPPVLDTFEYRDYLARRGIVSLSHYPEVVVHAYDGGNALKRALYDARTPLSESLEHSLPEPEGALARGILLGQRASIPEDVNDAFNAAGISHLIAISGYNVMLVAGAVIGAVTPAAGRRRATLVAMGVVVAYAAFVGGEPSVLRATLMALVMLGATLAGRPGSGLTAVALAGAALVAWRPLIIQDISFQLSFAATLGLVTLATPVREWLLEVLDARLSNAMASAIADNVSLTFAASLAVTPIIAANFGRLSLISLPANLLATLMFPFALLGAFVTALAGVVDASLGRATGEIAYLPLHYLVVLADLASRVPLASVAVSGFGWVEAAMLYIALLALAAALAQATKDVVAPGSLPRVGAVPAFAFATVLVAGYVWWGALQPPDDNLRLTVLDVGQGEAILIEAPSGTRVLVDGGPSGAAVMNALGDVLSPSERRIDLMVLTHGQDDHVTGLVEVLERYEVGAVLWNGLPGETGGFQAWMAAVSLRRLPVSVAVSGQTIDLGDGVYMDVLHPQPVYLRDTQDDQNNNAVVLRLVYGDVSFLLTGDIEAEAEEAILHAGHDVTATVLKVAHHGSDGATTRPFLEAASPSLAVVSAGEDNPFGHPSPSLRLRLAGVPLLRTDLNGNVRFETDGRRLWLDYERGEVGLVEPAFVP